MRIGSVLPAVLRKDAATELQDPMGRGGAWGMAWMLLMLQISINFPMFSWKMAKKSGGLPSSKCQSRLPYVTIALETSCQMTLGLSARGGKDFPPTRVESSTSSTKY